MEEILKKDLKDLTESEWQIVKGCTEHLNAVVNALGKDLHESTHEIPTATTSIETNDSGKPELVVNGQVIASEGLPVGSKLAPIEKGCQ